MISNIKSDTKADNNMFEEFISREKRGAADRNSDQQLVQMLQPSIDISNCNICLSNFYNPSSTQTRSIIVLAKRRLPNFYKKS